jgi:hypothetical protein
MAANLIFPVPLPQHARHHPWAIDIVDYPRLHEIRTMQVQCTIAPECPSQDLQTAIFIILHIICNL